MIKKDGTIDITELAASMQSTFVAWAVEFAFNTAYTTPGLQWMGLPLVNQIIKSIIRWVAETISKSAMMQAFYINTAIRKSSQASDYVLAVHRKISLPPTASDEEYERAERAEIVAFNNFVRISN